MDDPYGYLFPTILSGNEFGLHDFDVLIEKGKTHVKLLVRLNEKGAHSLV